MGIQLRLFIKNVKIKVPPYYFLKPLKEVGLEVIQLKLGNLMEKKEIKKVLFFH
jgi:hypothetical protein